MSTEQTLPIVPTLPQDNQKDVKPAPSGPLGKPIDKIGLVFSLCRNCHMSSGTDRHGKCTVCHNQKS